MSSCDISITFDKSDRTYAIGEEFECTITIKVNKAVNCDGLMVSTTWKTHGKGNRCSGLETKRSIFKGHWQPGTYTYKYKTKANSKPLTYHGKVVSVDWYVNVSVDIDWAIDPKASEEFIVVLPEFKSKLQSSASPRTKRETFYYQFSPLALLTLAPILGGGWLIYYAWSESDFFWGILGAVFIYLARFLYTWPVPIYLMRERNT